MKKQMRGHYWLWRVVFLFCYSSCLSKSTVRLMHANPSWSRCRWYWRPAPLTPLSLLPRSPSVAGDHVPVHIFKRTSLHCNLCCCNLIFHFSSLHCTYLWALCAHSTRHTSPQITWLVIIPLTTHISTDNLSNLVHALFIQFSKGLLCLQWTGQVVLTLTAPTACNWKIFPESAYPTSSFGLTSSELLN